ncbi:CAF1 family ribonuclease domain-containing protein [Ditylenchus destructor]|uniref:CAF1 family ribonuclease domain-containing protein n=1 Tax=Ditylenchus destructor TaxID=166010 RepID=A0AAD4NGN5_9BILA|nr:CAF1 family ribonuclease domain-containing protein [Ditylenchus destructor]
MAPAPSESAGQCDPLTPPKSVSLDEVPVIEVNRYNINRIWPYLMISVRKSHLVAIDLELSGLGNRCHTKSSFPDRYKNVREAAESRSILSVGIATFELRKRSSRRKKLHYKCQVFNILSFDECPFMMEPEALLFLAYHGFDFNLLLKNGVRYNRKKPGIFHSLWEEILAAGVPLCLHNGLVDLAFIHHHFYYDLPQSEDEFLANLTDWFGSASAGEGPSNSETLLWDSKYIAEFGARLPASFLEYIFRRSQRLNVAEYRERESTNSSSAYLSAKFSCLDKFFSNSSAMFTVDRINCSLQKGNQEPVSSICQSYRNFGFCRKHDKAVYGLDADCPHSHSVDLLLDMEERKSEKKRQRRKRRLAKFQSDDRKSDTSETLPAGTKKSRLEFNELKATELEAILRNTENNSLSMPEIATNISNGQESIQSRLEESASLEVDVNGCSLKPCSSKGSHRAGFDAFMTGYSTIFLQRRNLISTGNFDPSYSNKLCLPAKDFPLMIRKSAFAPTQSERHQQNWARIKSRRPRDIG